MSFFLIIFFSVYGGMHLYVFTRAARAISFGYRGGVPLAIFMLFMVFAPIFIRLLERGNYEGPARLLAFVSYSWLGVIFLFVSTGLVIDLYRASLFLAAKIIKGDLSYLVPSASLAFFLPLGLSLLIALYGRFEANNIRTERISIKSSKIPGEIGSVRIAQISDLHIGLIIGRERVGKVVDIIKREKPDMLVSTGDLVDAQSRSLDGISEFFREIKPRYGKYAVTGNHEYYAGLKHTLEFTRKAGFVVLRGAGATVSGVINIAGVDDRQGVSFDDYLGGDERAILEGLPDDRFTILLKHRPFIGEGSAGLFDLQLSGHTHKGQIFPFALAVGYFYPNLSGIREVGKGSKLYTSRGTGTWGPPLRFLSPPEVTIIEISYDDKAPS